ncbi:hypothetical protein F8388_007687 [Cannabis sativa]|uniref:Uncharacterized protein n=1 Tax=Cannabis sativa TaxID=3483 RepID=A0A7J6FSR9_CANSA|nr:hypothetical protein F8388_007687 [Cannabis sativa]
MSNSSKPHCCDIIWIPIQDRSLIAEDLPFVHLTADHQVEIIGVAINIQTTQSMSLLLFCYLMAKTKILKEEASDESQQNKSLFHFISFHSVCDVALKKGEWNSMWKTGCVVCLTRVKVEEGEGRDCTTTYILLIPSSASSSLAHLKLKLAHPDIHLFHSCFLLTCTLT